MSGSLNIETTPPRSYIVNEHIEKQKGKPREKTMNGKNRQLAQNQTLTQGGHEIASLELERTNLFHRYIMMKQTRLNWENKIRHPIKGRLPDEV